MKVSIMQPNIFMWGGLLKSIIDSDLHIVLDTVKSSKNSTYNRNKIAGNATQTWITIPFVDFKRSKKIMYQKLDTSHDTRTKIINLFKSRYSNANYYQNGLDLLDSTIFSEKAETKLTSIYINFIESLKALGLPICEIKFASNIIEIDKLDEITDGIELVNFLLRKVNANKYLASENTVNYCSPKDFHVKEVHIQKFTAKKYRQCKNSELFVPNLSCLDFISFLNNEEIIDNLDISNTWHYFTN